MADKKISQLTAATTPLDGTEVLPIVQSSSTVQVSVANLTAGRAVNADSMTLASNLGVGGAPGAVSPEPARVAARHCRGRNIPGGTCRRRRHAADRRRPARPPDRRECP